MQSQATSLDCNHRTAEKGYRKVRKVTPTAAVFDFVLWAATQLVLLANYGFPDHPPSFMEAMSPFGAGFGWYLAPLLSFLGLLHAECTLKWGGSPFS